MRFAGQLHAGQKQQSHSRDRQRRGHGQDVAADQDMNRHGEARPHEQGQGQVEQRQGLANAIAPPDQASELSGDMLEPLGREIEVRLAAAEAVALLVELADPVLDPAHPVRCRDDQRPRRRHEQGGAIIAASAENSARRWACRELGSSLGGWKTSRLPGWLKESRRTIPVAPEHLTGGSLMAEPAFLVDPPHGRVEGVSVDPVQPELGEREPRAHPNRVAGVSLRHADRSPISIPPAPCDAAS